MCGYRYQKKKYSSIHPDRLLPPLWPTLRASFSSASEDCRAPFGLRLQELRLSSRSCTVEEETIRQLAERISRWKKIDQKPIDFFLQLSMRMWHGPEDCADRFNALLHSSLLVLLAAYNKSIQRPCLTGQVRSFLSILVLGKTQVLSWPWTNLLSNCFIYFFATQEFFSYQKISWH